jgi:hypothetical protein
MENKILLFDIEVSPNVSYSWFGQHEVNIIEHIEEGYILSFAYKFLGDKSVKAYSLMDFRGNEESKRSQLVKKLWELFNESSVLIAHNGDQFDVKWANRAFIKYGLTPPSPYKQVDTLKIARSKFKFNDNRLNSLGGYLGIGSKLETGGFPLWKACMMGDKKAFKKMVKYNKQDVVLLEKVYLKLRSWATSIPNVVREDGHICPCCGSKDVVAQGYKILAGKFKRQQFQCKSCGRWSSSKDKIKIREDYLV